MMGNKSLWWVLASLGLIVTAGADDGTVFMDRYPSTADIHRMQSRGIRSLVISPVDHPGAPATLNFPDAPKVERLNDLDRAAISVHVVTSSYPNPAALNKLKEHVSLDAVVDNCLTSTSEKARLIKIRRPLSVTVLCRTDNQVAKADRLAAQVMAESPVSVSVRRVRD